MKVRRALSVRREVLPICCRQLLVCRWLSSVCREQFQANTRPKRLVKTRESACFGGSFEIGNKGQSREGEYEGSKTGGASR